jgi:sulfide:quinone oxidoreductase
VRHVDHERGVIEFEGDAELGYDVLLGVPKSVAPSVVRESALAGPNGFIRPDRHTLRTAFERVYAVGDCTEIPTANGQLPKAGVFAAAEGRVAARNIVADLAGGGATDRFEGHGFCFLELPGPRVAFVEGDFYADPPEVHITEADEEQFRRKQQYERDNLDAWLG